MLSITVEGVNITDTCKCQFASFNGIPFFPRQVSHGQKPKITATWTKSADMIEVFERWVEESKDCPMANFGMNFLINNCLAWLHIGDVDLSLQDLIQVKLVHSIYQTLVEADFNEWSHWYSCMVHRSTLQGDELPDPKYEYTGFGSLNRAFQWDSKKKIITWYNSQSKESVETSLPQILDGETFWNNLKSPCFRSQWREARHHHEEFHQSTHTTCDAWANGPQSFHLTTNTANTRALTLHTHLAKSVLTDVARSEAKNNCPKCSWKLTRCAACKSQRRLSKDRITKLAGKKLKPTNFTIQTTVNVSGELNNKSLWEVMESHVKNMTSNPTTSHLVTKLNNINIESSFLQTSKGKMDPEERQAFIFEHRRGLCYEANASLLDPIESWEED